MKKSLFPPPWPCSPSAKVPKKKRERETSDIYGAEWGSLEKKTWVGSLSFHLDCPKNPFSSFPSFLLFEPGPQFYWPQQPSPLMASLVPPTLDIRSG